MNYLLRHLSCRVGYMKIGDTWSFRLGIAYFFCPHQKEWTYSDFSVTIDAKYDKSALWKIFQIINSIFLQCAFVWCFVLQHGEKIKINQGFSIYRVKKCLLCLVVSSRPVVYGLLLGRVDFLLIYLYHQHQPATAYIIDKRHPPEGDSSHTFYSRGVV